MVRKFLNMMISLRSSLFLNIEIMEASMKKTLLAIFAITFSSSLIADHHKAGDKHKDSRMHHPNHLLNFKECKETKDAVGKLLMLADSSWKEIENNPENKEEWAKAGFLAELSANYSTVYDVWCKDMVNKRVKMGMMKKKKESKKD